MIIDEFVKIKWNSANIKYYKDIGYIYTKCGEEFEVKINELSKGSNTKIHVKCDYCGKEKKLVYHKYLKNYNNCNKYSCSVKCSQQKTKEKHLKKYGVNYYVLTDEFKEKSKATCLKNNGCENPSQNEKIRNKKKITWLKNYGVDNPTKSNKIVEKSINTCIEKYGEAFLHFIPRYNPNSIIYLDLIAEKINIKIQHALNDGEKKFQRYWIDGYIKEYNICIEWNEKKHNTKKYKQHDILKEKYIIDNFNCKFFKINEKEFLKDININIEIISKEILNYINELKNNIISL